MYDVIVVGAGHAGCEAAAAAANTGAKTLLITMQLQNMAQMSCNPAVGGIAKGQIVREIDALGGYMGIITDQTAIQFKMLNKSKGPAMWSPRAQSDRMRFSEAWRLQLERLPNLDFFQEMVTEVLIEGGKATGVKTSLGSEIRAKSVVLTNGTFLNGIIHIGLKQLGGGRAGEKAAKGITECLVAHGFEAGRMKTGTPPRVDGRSLDYSKMTPQPGDENPEKFSYLPLTQPLTHQLDCYMTYTSEEVHDILGLLVFVMPPLYGEGHEVINHLKAGHPELSISSNIFGWNLENPWVVILLLGGLVLFKVVATSVTFGAGGVGGIFSPMLFMGGVMGNCFARIINQIDILPYKLPLANFTLIGMTALMTGVLHAPLTAIFLIAEVTGGYSLFVPAMVTAVVSFSIAKYFNKYSIYTMELGRKGELVNQDKDQAILTLMDMESVIETNFVPVYTDMTLKGVVYEAVRESSRNIFPVLDREKGSLEGVILLDDIRHLIFEKELYDKVSVLEMMQPPPALIQMGQDTMNQVMDKFQNTAAWNLPVVKNGKYIGFISKSKLLTVYRRKLIYFSNNK